MCGVERSFLSLNKNYFQSLLYVLLVQHFLASQQLEGRIPFSEEEPEAQRA